MSSQAIMILGMHRSGISALAGLLMCLGVDGPKKLLGASPKNALRHLEPLDPYNIQDRLLESAGSSWKDIRSFSEAWLKTEAADLYQAELMAFIDENFEKSPLFFLKDPRNCRLMGLWKRVLAAQSVSPLYLLTHRNPIEVAKSLEKRDGLDVEYSYLLWLRHVLDAEISTRGSKRSFTSYVRIMDDWPAEVEKISSDLGVSWPKYDAVNLGAIEAMIRPDLKTFSDHRLIRSAVFPATLKKTLEVLDHWAAHGEQSSDYAVLDQIRNEFENSLPLFYPAVKMDHAVVQAERDAAREATEAAQAETKARAEALAQATAACDALHDALDAITTERDLLSEKLDLTHSTLEQRKAELTDTLEELKEKSAAVEEAGKERAALSEQLALSQVEVKELHRSLSRSAADMGRLQRRLIAATSERNAAHEELARAQARVERSAAQAKAYNERVIALEQSRSFRITAPLRWVMRRLRK